MNEKEIVNKMIDFIEMKERELQVNKTNMENHSKNDIVKSIMDELESEIKNENN